jgi:tetratricopeptide (TPR) repeat protein
LARKYINKGDYEKAFGFLFSAADKSKNPYEIYADLGELYSETAQFEKAIEYWFKYLYIAPKDKISTAYEELAMNFFCLDKTFEAGYYVHKKIALDGFLSREGLGEEIANVISDSMGGREAYHIAYPFERADYSHEKKLGKRALSSGDTLSACKIFNGIPTECMDEESFGDKAVANFMQGEDEESIKTCKESLKRKGENITAYCNLCTCYYNKHDDEKADFYYKKALALYDKSVEKSYLLASCAIEQRDHFTANECLSKILLERKYDIMMRVY